MILNKYIIHTCTILYLMFSIKMQSYVSNVYFLIINHFKLVINI